jgi:hypothetical protein
MLYSRIKYLMSLALLRRQTFCAMFTFTIYVIKVGNNSFFSRQQSHLYIKEKTDWVFLFVHEKLIYFIDSFIISVSEFEVLHPRNISFDICDLFSGAVNFILIRILGGGVHTGSTRHVGHFWLIIPVAGECENWEHGGMKIIRGNRSTRVETWPSATLSWLETGSPRWEASN